MQTNLMSDSTFEAKVHQLAKMNKSDDSSVNKLTENIANASLKMVLDPIQTILYVWGMHYI